MDSHIPYILPLKGLKDGQHQFSFDIKRAFFQVFEDSPVEEAALKINVELDKKPALLVLDFSFSGTVQSACDRCLAPINLPIEGDNRLLVKYGEAMVDSDEDVVYIPHETANWSIAQYIYEYILLALPLIKMYDCENDKPMPCDLALLDRLNEIKSPPEETPKANPFSEALKGWNK